ncbi:MAG: NfeD family protein [Acidobacteria bacterium]|nr:NfeD family protein [Acidobacteriota bacterium]
MTNSKILEILNNNARSPRNLMEQFSWILWAILGVFFIIAEVFTLGFVLFWFGIGAAAAALAAYLGLGMFGQFIVFALVSTVLTVMSRTIFDDYYPHNDGERLKSGIETLPGQIGTVKKGSRGSLNAATVSAFGTNWKAFPVNEDVILNEGDKVEIVRVEGASIYVRKADRELRGWKDED